MALDPTSGNLAGLINSRDQIVGGFLNNLNSLANTVAFEFNKVYASGQGLTGYQSVTSQVSVTDPTAPLDAAGLTNAPVNGSFDIEVNDPTTGQTQTSTINVDLTGLGQDTTLNSVVQQLNAVSGVSASINSQGQLTIASTSPNDQLAFANDTSGLLASLGINTFFTGTTALDLGVNSDVASDPSKFAASQGGIGQDTNNAVALAGFYDSAARQPERLVAFGSLQPTGRRGDPEFRTIAGGGQRLSNVPSDSARRQHGGERRQH